MEEAKYTCFVSESTDMSFHPNAPADGFLFFATVKNKYEHLYFSAARDQWICRNITTDLRPITRKMIYISRNNLIMSSNADSEDALLMQQHLGIPLEEGMTVVPQIKQYTINLANEPNHRAPSLMSIRVEISKWSKVYITNEIMGEGFEEENSFEDEYDDILLSEMESFALNDGNPATGTPAAREAIDDLLRNNTITILKADEVEPCAVCLENFSCRMVAIKMPCEHLFHTECICRWLTNSNKCPICRFEIRTVEP